MGNRGKGSKGKSGKRGKGKKGKGRSGASKWGDEELARREDDGQPFKKRLITQVSKSPASTTFRTMYTQLLCALGSINLVLIVKHTSGTPAAVYFIP